MQTHYTPSGTRLHQWSSSDSAHSGVNLVLVPGGPGMGSEYFLPLIPDLVSHATVWQLDFAGNGSNQPENQSQYQHWQESLQELRALMQGPIILAGHSFGAMLLLSDPKVETYCDGLILLSGLPSTIFDNQDNSYLEEPGPKALLEAYRDAPSDNNLKALILALAPLYFKPEELPAGLAMLEQTACSHHAYDYFFQNFLNSYKAAYIPTLPTLILSGDGDIVTPLSYFEQDERFHTDAITIRAIDQANHFPWINNPSGTVDALKDFLKHFR